MDSLSRDEFVQSFLEESGDHLQSINRNLLALEDSLSHPSKEAHLGRPARLDELLRSFHTIKGLSSMVGLRDATRLSHAMETVLQALQRKQLELTGDLIDRLFEAARTLEQVIDTLRVEGAAPVEIQADLDAVSHLLAPRPPAAPPVEEEPPEWQAPPPEELLPALAGFPEIVENLGEQELYRISTALESGRSLALAIFTPSPEKSERGENFSHVREQLAAGAEEIRAMPLVSSAGVRFAFLVASDRPLDPQGYPGLELVDLTPEPPAQESAPPGAAPAPLGARTFVRVELDRLDDLTRQAGDLMTLQVQLAGQLASLRDIPSPARRDLGNLSGRLARSLRALNRAILHARLVPLSEVFDRMPLVVRDLARSEGKQVRLVIEGEETQVDKALVDPLLDPLVHLVRNAIVHGIEPPAERAAAGKPSYGTLTVRGAPAGDNILVSVADDGRGIRLGASGDERDPGDDSSLLERISRPGFTTAGAITLGAGRGVGLDIVQRMAKTFGGRLSLQTEPGAGSTFTLTLPYTLVVLDAILVRCGAERYAVPRSMVDQVIEIDPETIVRLESGELLPFRDESLALVRLDRLFHVPQCAEGPDGRLYGLVLGDGRSRAAVVVDRLLNLREVVVKPLKDPLVARPGVMGATDLGDGSPVLILDLPSIVRLASTGLDA